MFIFNNNSVFIFNFFILVMSTIMVFAGKIAPVEKIRFLIAFKLPWDMPQLLNVASFPKRRVIELRFMMLKPLMKYMFTV